MPPLAASRKLPAPCFSLENVLSQVCAAQQSHKNVDQVQITHGLEGAEPDQGGRSQNDHGDALLEDAVEQDGHGEPGEECLTAPLGTAQDEPEDDQRADSAEPFVPCPLVKPKPSAGYARPPASFPMEG